MGPIPSALGPIKIMAHESQGPIRKYIILNLRCKFTCHHPRWCPGSRQYVPYIISKHVLAKDEYDHFANYYRQVLGFSAETFTCYTFYHSSILIWHVGSWNPSSWKTRANLVYMESISWVLMTWRLGSRRFENLWTGLLVEEKRTESSYPTSEADKNLTVPDITEWLGMRTVGTV